MSSDQRAPSTIRIWSLNYHEVTQDPRVLKQARVLHKHGFNVRVLCDAPAGLPLTDKVNGIDITRFDWSNFASLQPTDVKLFDFLKKSKSIVLPMFEPLVREAERLRSFEQVPMDAQIFLEDTRLHKSYYQNARGLARDKLKKSYRLARIGLLFQALTKAGARHAYRILKSRDRIQDEAKGLFRDLHQARALVFAANALRVETVERPDVIHAHDIFTLVAGVLLAKKFNCRLIYDAHELETARATNVGPLGADFVDAFERDCLAHVDALITVSKSIGDIYAERCPKRRPVIVMNAPEIAVEQDDGSDLPNIRQMAGLDEKTPLLVFTGGIQRGHRGVDKVLEALQYLPDVHLATMGPRHEKNDAWFRLASEQLGVSERVHMLDSVDARQVVPTISSANVSVIPFQAVSLNHEYAMPNKLFEAAFAKVPLAVSELTEMKRFVEELGIGRVMDQRNPKDIAEVIKHILNNPEQYTGAHNISTVLQEEYSWAAQAKKLIALYNELLS